MLRIALSLITFLSLTGFTFSQGQLIRGFVHDKSNGEALPFKKVKLLGSDSSIVAGSQTDVNGFFSIPKIGIGNYIIKIDDIK